MDQKSAGVRSPDLLRHVPGSRRHPPQRARGAGIRPHGLRGLPAERHRGPRVRPRPSLQETAAHRLGRPHGGPREFRRPGVRGGGHGARNRPGREGGAGAGALRRVSDRLLGRIAQGTHAGCSAGLFRVRHAPAGRRVCHSCAGISVVVRGVAAALAFARAAQAAHGTGNPGLRSQPSSRAGRLQRAVSGPTGRHGHRRRHHRLCALQLPVGTR